MSPFMHEAVPHRSKRVRFSHEPSSPTSPSAGSALASPTAKDDATTTTKNARDDGTQDSDTSSILSSSSEEPSSDESSSEEEEEDDDDESDNEQAKDTEMALEEPKGTDGVINLRANRGKKPIMKLSEVDLGPDIRGFLKDFLPQLKAANEELMAQKRAGTLKKLDDEQDQEEGAPYIEMDLGLGVLEEKDPNVKSDGESDIDMEDAGADKDVLGKLMGRDKKMDPAGIEEVPNATSS